MMVLFLFLVIINILGIGQFRNTLTKNQSTQEHNEAELFASFISSLIVQRDFAKIVDFVDDWGPARNNVVKVVLTSSNEYVIAKYISEHQLESSSKISKEIGIENGSKYILLLEYDRTELNYEIQKIEQRLIIASSIIFIFLSVILWKIFVKTAIFPLQKEVIRHKKTAENLFKAKQDAEKANKVKSEFLANMSHEIRTPMNGILGMLHLVKDTDLTKEQFECINTATTSAKTLLVIINDILDFSKIESGKLDIEKTDFDLQDTISNIATLFSESAFKHGLELAVDINTDVPVFVRGDPTRLGQVVSNLLGNALKFTKEGEIVISLELKKMEKDEIYLHLKVKDTGIGIPKETHEKIFMDFSQADTTTTRFYGGTGLGLSISKHLVELMGGEIGLDSEVGVGSTFWFDFVVEKSKIGSEDDIDIIDFEKQRVLVVDDNETNRKILDKQLSSWSLPHVIVDNGITALEKVNEAGEEGKQYNCILLDMMMPNMDGLEVAAKLQEIKGAPKVIMLSSGSTIDVINALEKKLIQSYLLKPVRSSMLFNAISAVISGKQEPTIKEHITNENNTYSGKFVLVVEDNAINQRVITLLLGKMGVVSDIANHGIEALEKIKLKSYDLVFMDCQMPEMDGFAATTAIRKLESGGEHLNIVAMTANAMQDDKKRCLDVGMDDYLSKPIKPVILKECLSKWLGD